MPIKGLTDRGMAFPELGRIRKGAPKPENSNRPGADLKYFRVVFDAKEKDAEAEFHRIYGDQPTEIDVVFPFNDFDRQASFYLEAYSKGRMIARSDGQVYLSKLAPNGEVLALGGVWVSGDKQGQPALYDPSVPEYSYRTSNGGTQNVFCKAITRIKVVVPGLQRLAYLMLVSSSVYDAMNLSEQLEGLWEMTGHRWAGVPLILKRKPRMVMCPDEQGKRSLREKWLLSIEANPRWVQARLSGMEHSALLLAAGDTLALPEPTLPTQDPEPEEDFEEGAAEGEFEDSQGEAPEQPQTDPETNELWARWAALARQADAMGIEVETFKTMPEPEELRRRYDELEARVNASKEGGRPMQPDALRAFIADEAKKLKGAKNTSDQMQAVVGCLEYLCQGKGARLEFLGNLTQKPITSTKDLPPEMVVALFRYLKPYYDENATVYLPAADVERYVTQEVTTAHAQWLKDNGQGTLFN